ncbi:MAG: hypothetical protein ACREQ5_03650 [Candidatus Dormibacteria bacterium]
MPQHRMFILKMLVSDEGQFQVSGTGSLTPAEVIAGLRMYEWQVLSGILKGGNAPTIEGFNPRKIS